MKKIKGTWLCDIEVYPDLFFVGIKDFKNKKVFSYEVSERKDERDKLFKDLTSFSGFFVSFNGLHYDEVVLLYFIKNYKSLLKDCSLSEFFYFIKDVSDSIINEDWDTIKLYKYAFRDWTSIDLFLYWSKMLRISKQISLKSLGIQLNHEEVQELPFPITHLFGTNEEEIEQLIHYNIKNDLGILEKLFVKMQGEVELRHYILKEYGIPSWSMDAPKIASEYLLEDYCRKTFNFNEEGDVRFQEIEYKKYKKEIRNQRYYPKPFKIGDYLPPVNFKTKFFKNIHKEFCENGGDFYKEVPFNKNDTSVMLLPSVGGIHSKNDNQYWESDEEWVILDSDVASLYPTLFKIYEFLRGDLKIVLDKYVEIIEDRLIAKRNKDKKKDKFLKLILNGFSGLADSNVTWVYSPEQVTALRVLGQLIQLRFIEDLSELDGVKVFFTNTDGTCIMIKRKLIPEFCKIAKNIEKEFKITWEFTFNKKMVFSNTNSYISVIEEKFMLDDDLNFINHETGLNEIKRKGAVFRYGNDIPLGDSVNEQVIPRALEAYFVNGISPEEFISNPLKYNISIFDYCCSKKVNKSFNVYYGDDIIQNINRYYFSKKGLYLMKLKKKSTGNKNHMHKGYPVKLLNIYNPETSFEEYDINYSYYIAKAKRLISEMEFSLTNPTLNFPD